MTQEQINKMTNEDKMNLLLSLPLFQKMIEVATGKAKENPEYLTNLNLDELKEDAQNSTYEKMIEFRNNKEDMDLLAAKTYIRINLNNLQKNINS